MATQDIFELVGEKENTGIIREFWLMNEPALVAVNEDPEHRHRIKVIVPSLKEDTILDKWIDRWCWWTGDPGYGDYHYPELGSEVTIGGMRGQKHHLFYVSRFNEDFLVPKDFWGPPDTRGFRTDGDYKSIVELDHFMRAGRFVIEADASVRITAPAGFFVNGKRVDPE